MPPCDAVHAAFGHGAPPDARIIALRLGENRPAAGAHARRDGICPRPRTASRAHREALATSSSVPFVCMVSIASRATFWWHVLLVAGLCALVGCRGSGRIELASLNLSVVDPPPPRCTPIEMQECCWWTDESGRVCIAMQRRQTPVLYPKMRFEFQLSLVLPQLPAGRARNYKVDRNTLRARVRLGPWESRFTSHTGTIALYRDGESRLRGSMRLQAERVTSQWLGGWGKPIRYLMLGSFRAVCDERRGRAIAELAESSGWDRGQPKRPPLSSQPAPPSSAPSPSVE